MITTKLILPTPSRIFASWPEMNRESKDLSGPGDELPSVEISGPSSPRTPESGESEKKHGLSATLLNQHDVLNSKPPPLEWIVVRIEVTDTGCGIRQKDMAQTKLFCMSFPNICWLCWVLNLFLGLQLHSIRRRWVASKVRGRASYHKSVHGRLMM